ncbi:MAG: hypothetical protein QOG61_2423 [Candidatus Binataceae bacterium]|nr:hypothetical protein [Candidatus Binataceae bacterium]
MGALAVKLRVDDITADAKELSFSEPEGEINRALGLGPIREYRLEGPVNVALNYYRAGTEIFFRGEFTAATVATCARCAEEFVVPSGRGFRYVLAPRAIGDDRNAGLRVEDLEFSLYDGEEVDLTPLIREQMLLALPTRPLCREDCRGLCPRCGANLNEHDCGCSIESADSRLAILRTIKVNRPN